MRTLKMTLAYVGTRFAGWQVQPARPTIQGILEDRLSRMLQEEVRLAGAGRTDAGVHAMGQIASFTTVCRVPLEGLRRGLNARLPEEIRLLDVEEAAVGFHARSDARGKEYRYRLSRAEVVSPFAAPYVTPVRAPLDVPAMQEAARGLLGRHDFTSFAPAGCTIEDRTRTLTLSRVEEDGDELIYTVRGEGFLRHMVRTMIGTIVEAGRGRIRPAAVAEILAARDRRRAGPCAPARGLTLVRVFYGGEET